MTKLAVDRLVRKQPNTQPKSELFNQVADTAKKVRKKVKHWTQVGKDSQYERTPKVDTVEVKSTSKSQNVQKVNQKDTKNRVWNFYEKNQRKIANEYTNDLESVAQEIPEASFSREANQSSVKGLESTIDKLLKNEELFAQGGLTAAVRDGVRGTIFIPNPEKNYIKIVEAMEKRGYKIDATLLEKDGMVVLGEDGLPKMGKDIDVRCGKNAVPSGYEDVQIRFYKGKGRKKQVYELLVLSGPNYLNFKNKEHSLVYEQFRKYKSQGFKDDRGAKSIIDDMKEQFNILTRKLYADAKSRDENGASSVTETIAFSQKGVQKINEYMKSLKALFAGKHSLLPPSRQKKPFQETKTYTQLDEIEQNLRDVIDIYKPKD